MLQLLLVAIIATSLISIARHRCDAQASTPTPDPLNASECRGGERLSLIWKAITREAKVILRMSKCDPPQDCDGSATVLTSAPLTLIIEDAAGRRITGHLDVVDFAKKDICPGGHETYELGFGRVRYVFGNRGDTKVVMKASLRIDSPPVLEAPLRFSLTDSNGYALGTTLPDCNVRSSDSVVRLRCQNTSTSRNPTVTPKASPTSNKLPTRTPIPTRTSIPTSTPVPTRTSIPTSTPVPTRTPIPTRTPVPTRTPIA